MKGIPIKPNELSSSQKREMFERLKENFHGIEKEIFESDLAKKNWVVLFESADGKLQGFSTIYKYNTEFNDKKYCVIYSGDTIIEKEAWGSLELPRVWINTIKKIHTESDNPTLIWLVISSGFRTYRFLPVFWRVFYPHCRRQTPEDIQNLMHKLATDQFGDCYDPERGIVSFEKSQILIETLGDVPESRLQNPHIAFFNKRNPGRVKGDNLVCITEISENNLTKAGKRMYYSPESE